MRYIITLMLYLLLSPNLMADACYVNEQGVKLVKHYEGFSSRAYFDGGSGRWAVGYGTQRPQYKITPKTVWTEKHADKILRKELDEVARELCNEIKVPVTQNQLAAVSSLAYNVGTNAINNSNLLKKLNNNDFKGAASSFTKYIRSKGRILHGLKVRRKIEQKLFLTPDYEEIDVEEAVLDVPKKHKKIRQHVEPINFKEISDEYCTATSDITSNWQ